MTDDNSREVQPVTAFQRGFVGVVDAFLRRHFFLRHIVAAMGAILLFIGGISTLLWRVPLFSWATGGQVAALCLTGGIGALGVWYFSDNSRQLQQGTVLQRVVAFIKGHPVQRFLLGTVGVMMPVAGVLCLVLQNVGGGVLSWVGGALVPFLLGGLGSLGIWYLSGKTYPSTTSSSLPGHDTTNKIFISYRRDDSRYITGRIYDRLVQHFGANQVFKDVDSIPLAVDFKQHLDLALTQCNFFLAVIGDDWLSAGEKVGKRRLHDLSDFVRIELESALERGIPVIPLFVQNATIPSEKDLPDILKPLIYQNGISIRPDPDFHHDMDRLIRGIETHS